MTDPAVVPLLESTPRSQEALVLQVTGPRLELRLRPGAGTPADASVISARLAIPNYDARPGDRVLVHSVPRDSNGSEHYVIGVLHASEQQATSRISTETGAYAERNQSELSLFDSAGRLLVRYDSDSGALELRSPADLHLAAPNGNLRLCAGKRVEVTGDEASMDARALTLRGQVTQIDFGRLEVRGERLLSRVAEAFVDVERVAETRAKRLRTLVESTLELVAQRTHIRSEKDTRIDGKRVLLG